ncbi:MAG: tRNA pseudouridine(38-40) synthase TruA [Micavibrio sp.]|nr:tRNA pseudouridine(38-40) synthase TruA [Micavibrio sp.]|tara:strand:+ start:154703 stop:155488 length:786 start_codon:yes stop_codon:yes gene_type:complete
MSETDLPTQRWKSIIEYDGSAYHGWQIQDNVITVQGQVEKAIASFSQEQIRIHAAGRTDTGVHAHGQTIHFDLPARLQKMSGSEISKAINAYLLEDTISVVHTEAVTEDFHARFSAQNKLYIYRILNRRSPSALDAQRMWHVKRSLDVENMREGAQHLIGQHDFTTFRATTCQANSPIRTINSLKITEQNYDTFGGKEIQIHVEAQSFLHHQIRNFAGTLAYVGLGKWTPANVKRALESKDRAQGGPTAPSCGLSLARIDY